ncbi:MAG: glutamate mutase L, partial [Candidatus Binatia bacterium]
MTSLAILIDFGSTFTKVTAVDLAKAEVVGRSQAVSTVLTDVREGLLQGLIDLHERHALFDGAPKDLNMLDGNVVLASSSAAGGLRIVVVGNVPGLTVEAANQAALGAGAKIVGSSAFKLTDGKTKELENLRPDMILLTGGVDGGDSETILHNARVLGQSNLSMPIVVAGNRAAVDEVVNILERSGKEIRVVGNVMARAGKLSVESAREAIRELFMERITQAKGLDALRGIVPVVLPTPMAVIQGVR